jgi:hypothetical protein
MDQFQIGERIWGTDRPFFLKVAHFLSKCTIPSGQRIEGSLADALLRKPHYLNRRKHQTTGGKHGKFGLPAYFP